MGTVHRRTEALMTIRDLMKEVITPVGLDPGEEWDGPRLVRLTRLIFAGGPLPRVVIRTTSDGRSVLQGRGLTRALQDLFGLRAQPTLLDIMDGGGPLSFWMPVLDLMSPLKVAEWLGKAPDSLQRRAISAAHLAVVGALVPVSFVTCDDDVASLILELGP